MPAPDAIGVDVGTGADEMCVSAGGWLWKLYLRDVTRIRNDWFIQLVAIGPRVCTIILRTNDPEVTLQAAPVYRRIVDGLGGSITRGCVFLDLLAD